jgi:predicted 3-demethylubiquinone-9 3-methyltransferase (glyoxalase superfamily)
MVNPSKLTPCLWFNFNAEAAVDFYTSVFPRSRVIQVSRYGDQHPALAGRVLMIWFEIEGVQFQALNGGPDFPFTEAVSLSVDCADQAEVDAMWSRLSEGGSTSRCGWLKDRFGLSWQIVPRMLAGLLDPSKPAQTARVLDALFTMEKIDIARLEEAAA